MLETPEKEPMQEPEIEEVKMIPETVDEGKTEKAEPAIPTYSRDNYREFKFAMDVEVKEVAAGFVRIGYFLKVARDTDVLANSGYKNVAEFAEKEYGLTKDIVSRYIAINDKYSEGGYSDRLQQRYMTFGVAKLTEMLTLPDAIADEITEEMTRQEIREIKHDLKKEQETSRIEIMCEAPQELECDNELESAFAEYFREPEHYREFFEIYWPELQLNGMSGEQINAIFAEKDRMLQVVAPTGIANYRVRVPQVGKVMISITSEDEPITIVNMRTMEKAEYDWIMLGEFLKKIIIFEENGKWTESYRVIYGNLPGNEPVAPAQLLEETAERQNTEPVLEEQKEAEKAAVENVENSEDIVEESDNMGESKEENDEENEKMEQYNASILTEDTETSEEDEKKAKILHVLKMLEKYHEYLNEDDLRALEAMLEDGKRRKREYGAFDVGSTL